MFEYQFPSLSFFSYFNPWAQNPLLKSIHIQGPFITLFGRKKIGTELDGTIKELKARVIQGDNGFEHNTCHSVDFGDGLSIVKMFRSDPHVHLTLPTSKSMQQGISDLIKAIFKRHDPVVRAQEHQTFLAEIDKKRIAAGHKELPENTKNFLAQIDTKSPFFLSQSSQELIQDILSKYGKYCTRYSNDRCRELLQMYIFGPLKSVFSIYYDLGETNFTDVEKERITLLLQPLQQIQQCINAAREKPYDAEVFQQIQTLIQQVKVNEVIELEKRTENYITEEISLQERLNFISGYAQERLKSIEAYKKTWRFTIDSLFSRISQVFYRIFSSPNPRTS